MSNRTIEEILTEINQDIQNGLENQGNALEQFIPAVDITTLGSELNFGTSTVKAILRLSNNRVMAFWSESITKLGKCQIIEMNENGVLTSLSSVFTFESSAMNGISISPVFIDPTHVVVFYTDNGLRLAARLLNINVSSGLISAVAASTSFNAGSTNHISAIKVDSTHVWVFYRGSGNDGFTQVFSVNIADGSFAADGTELEFDTTEGSLDTAQIIDSTHAVNFWRGTNNNGYCQVFELDDDLTASGLEIVIRFSATTDTLNSQPSSQLLNDSHIALFWGTSSKGVASLIRFDKDLGTIANLVDSEFPAWLTSSALIDNYGNDYFVAVFWNNTTDNKGNARTLKFSTDSQIISVQSNGLEFTDSLTGDHAVVYVNDGIVVDLWNDGSNNGQSRAFRVGNFVTLASAPNNEYHTVATLQEDKNELIWPMARISEREGKQITPQDTEMMQFYHRIIDDQVIEPEENYRGTANFQTVSWPMVLVGVGFRRNIYPTIDSNNNADFAGEVQAILAKNGRLTGKERITVTGVNTNKTLVLNEEYPDNDKFDRFKIELFAFSINYTILQRIIGNTC